MSVASGRLESIWIKRFRHGPMDRADAVQLVAGRGIVGNANQLMSVPSTRLIRPKSWLNISRQTRYIARLGMAYGRMINER